MVSIGLVVGATALFMGFVIPFSGWGERVIIGLFGGLFIVAIVKGFVHIQAGRVALHREWMIRAFAIAQIATLSVASFTAAFVAHASAAELWIRLTCRNAVAGVGAAETA